MGNSDSSNSGGSSNSGTNYSTPGDHVSTSGGCTRYGSSNNTISNSNYSSNNNPETGNKNTSTYSANSITTPGGTKVTCDSNGCTNVSGTVAAIPGIVNVSLSSTFNPDKSSTHCITTTLGPFSSTLCGNLPAPESTPKK